MEIHTEGGQHEDKRRTSCEHEDGHLQAREKGLEQILPSQPSEGTNPADTLILDFQPPELLFESHSLGYLFYGRPSKLLHGPDQEIKKIYVNTQCSALPP